MNTLNVPSEREIRQISAPEAYFPILQEINNCCNKNRSAMSTYVAYRVTGARLSHMRRTDLWDNVLPTSILVHPFADPVHKDGVPKTNQTQIKGAAPLEGLDDTSDEKKKPFEEKKNERGLTLYSPIVISVKFLFVISTSSQSEKS